MKKQYINPVCKVMTLSLKRNVMNELLGNTSMIPVGGVKGDGEQDGGVDDMWASKTNVWDD